jgi:hypothetical protein
MRPIVLQDFDGAQGDLRLEADDEKHRRLLPSTHLCLVKKAMKSHFWVIFGEIIFKNHLLSILEDLDIFDYRCLFSVVKVNFEW